tara:strand:- start:192545 stop:193564 length:1020 start_codon:yes stop_codon:yes gene_type:complete
MTGRYAIFYLVFMLAGKIAVADELIMKNGSRLVGTLISASQSDVVFETPFAGQITVKQANIEQIVADKKVTLMMQDGKIYRDKQIVTRDQRLLVMAAKQQPVMFDVADIKLVNPEPWRIGDGYKWYGQMNLAVLAERGNTDSDQMDIDFESIWRSIEDRVTVRGLWEIDSTDGTENKNAATLRNKYDRFRVEDPDNYIGAQVAFERDKFADLNLRTTVGPYLGRQFFETQLLSVQGEVGVVYVEEDYDTAPNDDYWGSNWELRLISDIIPDTQLYVNADGVFNFNHTDRQLINATVGVSLPVMYGLKAGAEVRYKYNGGAVAGVDELDETYNIKFGYVW